MFVCTYVDVCVLCVCMCERICLCERVCVYARVYMSSRAFAVVLFCVCMRETDTQINRQNTSDGTQADSMHHPAKD